MLPIAIRTGMKPVVIAGTLLMALVYVALSRVSGANLTLARLVLVSATADILYWPTYHAYFAALGEEEHRGRHLGVREASAAIIGIVSPLAFAAILVGFGAKAAFHFAGAMQLLAALPCCGRRRWQCRAMPPAPCGHRFPAHCCSWVMD